MKVRGWKLFLKRVGFVLVGLIVTVVLIEGFTRLFDPLGVSHFLNMARYRGEFCEVRLDSDRLFVHRTNGEMDLHGWEIRTDSRGFRGPEREMPKPAGTKRILFIGDSVTFGWGVNAEDTFVSMIEEEFAVREKGQATNPANTFRLETVNGGHLFHDSTQERGVLEEAGLDYEPDVIVLVFVSNDTHPTAQMLKPAKQRTVTLTETDLAEINSRAAVLENLRTIEEPLPFTHQLLKFMFTLYRNHRFIQRAENEGRKPTMLDRAGVDTELGWNLAQKAILEMKGMADEIGARFVVLDISEIERLEQFCEQETLLFGRIQHGENELTDVRNSRSDPHANRKGHRQYADKILQVIDELNLLE
ncbi:MAG: lysophospholipase L1-like esterase [Planctomycetota bacterium]|jgi:lysophospholipase L1-like esterase